MDACKPGTARPRNKQTQQVRDVGEVIQEKENAEVLFGISPAESQYCANHSNT